MVVVTLDGLNSCESPGGIRSLPPTSGCYRSIKDIVVGQLGGTQGSVCCGWGAYQHGWPGVTTYPISGLTAGSTCSVLLYFAETYLSAAGDREFNVAINATTVLTNLVIYGKTRSVGDLQHHGQLERPARHRLHHGRCKTKPAVMGIEVGTSQDP